MTVNIGVNVRLILVENLQLIFGLETCVHNSHYITYCMSVHRKYIAVYDENILQTAHNNSQVCYFVQ